MKRSIAWLLAAVMMMSGIAVSLTMMGAAGSSEAVLTFGEDGNTQATGEGLAVLSAEGMERWMILADGQAPVASIALNAAGSYAYLKMAYRTDLENATLSMTGSADTATVELTTSERWVEAVVAVSVDAAHSLTVAIDADDMECGNYVDVAYIALFDTEARANAYQYGQMTSAKYGTEGALVPTYNVTDEGVGSFYNTSGKPYGQRFTATESFRGIFVPQNSFLNATNNNNAGHVKVWAWNTDYATTTAAEPLRTVNLEKLIDKADLNASFGEALPAGEYFFEVTLTEPSARAAYVGKVSNGAHKAGVESYCGGEKTDKVLSAGYLVDGYGLVYQGNEYIDEPGMDYDFTVRMESATEEYGIIAEGVTVTDLCDKGYLSLVGGGADATVTLPALPYTYTNENDEIVIWYRAAAGGVTEGTFTAVVSEEESYTENVMWVADGEWHTMVISDTAWTGVLEHEITEFVLGGIQDFDLAYLGFYANASAASDATSGKHGAPAALLDPATVTPAYLMDGDRLRLGHFDQVEGAEYDYAAGSVTLKSKGTRPSYPVISETTKVAPILAIRYRVESRQPVYGDYYIGSYSTNANRNGDSGTIEYKTDGRWHTALIDLTELSEYNPETNEINYFVFDFMRGATVQSGSKLEIRYYAFFNTVEEAESFVHDTPRKHTVIFDTGLVQAYGLFLKTDTKESILAQAPMLYDVPGFTVAWEDFEVVDHDIVLRPVYTPIADYDPNEAFDELNGNGDSSTETDTETDTEVDTDTESVESDTAVETDSDTEAATSGVATEDTTDAEASGCKSVIASASALAVVAMAAGVVVCKKRHE